MITLVIGLVILIGGGLLYGGFCEKVFEPDDRKTPSYENEGGIQMPEMIKRHLPKGVSWVDTLIIVILLVLCGAHSGNIHGIYLCCFDIQRKEIITN